MISVGQRTKLGPGAVGGTGVAVGHVGGGFFTVRHHTADAHFLHLDQLPGNNHRHIEGVGQGADKSLSCVHAGRLLCPVSTSARSLPTRTESATPCPR